MIIEGNLYSGGMMLPYAAAQQTEENDLAKLTAIVEEAIEFIAEKTGLSGQDTLQILQEFSVEEIRNEKHASGQSFNASKFNKALDKAIRSIAYATGLNTSEISNIFTGERHAAVDSIVLRLREKSKQNRWSLSHY